jgi:hypothetical protein
MKHGGRLFFVLAILLMVLGTSSIRAQDTGSLTGQLVGRDDQPVPAQVIVRLTFPNSSFDTFMTAADGSFSYLGQLDPGEYLLEVDYNSIPDTLKAVLRASDLIPPIPITLPAQEPIRLTLLRDESGTAGCADIPLVFGTPSSAPVDTNRQIVYTLMPLLETKDLYQGEAYNPLGRSSLRIDTIYVDRNQHAMVMLEGEFVPNEPCDDVYAREQLEQTVLSLGVRGVTIVVNNQLLDTLLELSPTSIG